MTTAAWFAKGLQEFANGNIDFVNDDIREILVDVADWGVAITGATNATPIVITANSHGFSDGDVVMIVGVGGNTAANGTFIVANSDTNTFELTSYQASGVADGTNVAGNGSYTSGGYVISMEANEDLADLPAGGRVSTTALSSKTVSGRGVLDAANTTHSSVTGDSVELIVHYYHTGTESTSTLLYAIGSGTGFPLTPDGNNVVVTYPAAGIAQL